MATAHGWRAAFLITAGLGLVWIPLWLYYYRKPPIPSEEESGRAVSWLAALRYRETWGFALGKFLTDPVWWFYLIWLPPYFFDVRHFNLKEISWALPVIYLAASFGSVIGGWISGHLIARGWPVGRARKAAMLLMAACMPVAAMAVFVKSPVAAILLVSLATSAHQGWSANLFTTASDIFPSQVVASVVGIGGCAGGFGGFLLSAIVPGFVITYFGYVPVFVLMGVLHPLALAFVHVLMGRMEPRLQAS
jgi:ACS family hexuronate transporter-like MFS transporter